MASDYQLEDTLYLPFTTRAFATGIPTALVGGAVDIYEDVTATPIVTGETLTVSLNSVAGFNMITTTATAASGFEAGKSYTAILQAGTVDSVSVVGEVVAHFTIEKSASEKSIAAGVDVVSIAGVAQAATNLEILFDGNEAFNTAYAGPRGPGVYLDDTGGAAGSTNGVNGTIVSPTDTIASAKTLADSLGYNRIYLVNNTDITLAATMEDYEFVGLGSPDVNSVALASQDVDRSGFYNLTITGVQGGAERAYFDGCILAVATIHAFAVRCGLSDAVTGLTMSNNDDNVLDSCFSVVPGNSAPIIIGSGANLDLSIRHYSGGIELKTLHTTSTTSIETDGQVIFNADCSTSATVVLRGMMTITDNTGGMASLTRTAVPNFTALGNIGIDWANVENPTTAVDLSATDIQLCDTTTTNTDMLTAAAVNAECDTAISDAALATAAALATVDANVDKIPLSDGTNTWNATALASIQAEANAACVDVITVDAISEIAQGVPSATPNLSDAVMLMYMTLRNKLDVDTTSTDHLEVYNDAGVVITKKVLTDDGTVYSEAKMITGP